MSGRALRPTERAIGWAVGLPFASWRYISRGVDIRHDESTASWPMAGFPDEACEHLGEPETLQRPLAGYGPLFRRLYRLRVERPLLSAAELMSIILNDPNVACPLEVARFERDGNGSTQLKLGEEMRVRLPGPWNGPVRVVELSDCSFRLATLRGHMEAGEIEFRAHDDGDELLFEIESWARSGTPVFDFLYDRLRLARELQLDMWAFFLERVAQVSGGRASNGITIQTQRCDDHPL